MQKEQRQPLSMRSLVLLLMATLAIRLVATLVYWDDFHQDPDAYLALAQSWSSTGIYGLMQEDGITHPRLFALHFFLGCSLGESLFKWT